MAHPRRVVLARAFRAPFESRDRVFVEALLFQRFAL